MSEVAAIVAEPPRRIRSRVTNGSAPFVEGNGRSAWSRRWKDVCALHAADLGGMATLSEAQGSLIRRCATLEVELERLEGQMSLGQEVDLDLYARVAGHLRRCLETLGVDRVKRDVTPSLHDIIRKHAEKPPARPKSPAASSGRARARFAHRRRAL